MPAGKPLAARGDRIVAKSTLARQERDMAKIAHEAIKRYLAAVRRAVAHEAIRAAAPFDESDLGPDVDLNALDQSAVWPGILAETLMPAIDALILGLGPQDLLTPAAVTSINAWRAEWLTNRTQALAGVPDTITKEIRDAIQADIETNGPNPQAAAGIVKDILNPDAPTWKSRAMTIARTEVVGANNQGGLASWTAVHQSLAPLGGQVFKTWLATEDSKTRPEHSAIDGTEMPIGGTFTVGGEQMDGPGDGGASADLVINCRCTLTYRVEDGADAAADDARDDSITAAVEAPVTAPAVEAPPAAPIAAPPMAPAGFAMWEGPILPLDVPSPDGRMFLSAGMTIRDLPLPISYQAQGSHGGDDAGTSEIVGRQLTSSVIDGILSGSGDFFDPMVSMAPTAAMEQVAAGIGFVSANIAVKVMSYVAPGPDGTLIPIDPMQYMGDPMTVICVAEEWEYMGCCILDQPAFGQARINLVTDQSAPNLDAVTADAASPEGPILTDESISFPDGTVLSVGDQVNVIDASGQAEPATGLIEAIDPTTNQVTIAVEDPATDGGTTSVVVDAATLDPVESLDNTTDAATGEQSTGGVSGPDGITAALAFPALEEEHVYPADWFEPVALDGPTGLTITPEGRVYGHLALHDTCHTGFPGECVTAPESNTNYAYFHTGEAKTTDGLIAVGRLTVGGGHADLRLGWRGATEHYDNAGAAGAVVRAYRDEFGTQIAGGLVPNITKDQLAALRRSPLSGDWRPMGAGRELVAALSVNSGGFPVPRVAMAADGRPLGLVAAGVVHAAPGDGEPESGGLTLPSGAHLSAGDVAVLASAFADVTEQRRLADHKAAQRAADARELRRTLIHQRLKAVV